LIKVLALTAATAVSKVANPFFIIVITPSAMT